MPGAADAPAALRANEKSTQASHHRYTDLRRHSLHDGITAYSALFPVTGFLATVVCRSSSTNLASASGCQNHTASPSAKRIDRPATHLRPSHPALDVRDDASAPPDEHRTREELAVICPTAQAEFWAAPKNRLTPESGDQIGRGLSPPWARS